MDAYEKAVLFRESFVENYKATSLEKGHDLTQEDLEELEIVAGYIGLGYYLALSQSWHFDPKGHGIIN